MKNRISHIAKQTTACVSSLLIAVQPVFAQSIVADGSGPDVLRTNNGIDMVMIETPNAAGVSVNTFDQFNVAEKGAILNNIQGNYGVTNLGGFVQGNSNLSGGTANLIVNQVTSTNPSELLGYLEVGGAQANVVVANPYGITCDGCGFINTDHVALTTGSLTYDQDRLDRIQVANGVIRIGERGTDARGVSQFDLIARKVDFAGSVQGERVLVIAGQNDVIFATGAYELRDGDGTSVGEYAIDSNVFGGMYANKITIVSTEQGAGVRAPSTLSSSAQGMTITADGRLVIGTAASSGSISARSNSGSVVVQKTVQSQELLSLQAKRDLILEADAFIVTEATTSLTAERDIELGTSAQVLAGEALSISADDTLRLAESAGLMSYRDIGVNGGAMDVADDAMIYAGFADEGEAAQIGDLTLDLSGGASFDSASLFSTGSMSFDADDITITGDSIDPARFVSLSSLDIDLMSLTTTGARLEAAGDVDIALHGSLTAGTDTTVISTGALAISAVEMSIVGAVLQSGTTTDLTATGSISASKAQIFAQAELSLLAAANSIEGSFVSFTDRVAAQSTSGALSVDGTIAAQTGVDLKAEGALIVAGALQTAGAANLQGASVASSAEIVARGDITATAQSGDLTNSGQFIANGALTLQGDEFISTSGALQSGGPVTLVSSGDVTNNSDIASNTGITIISGGNLTSTGDFVTLGDLRMSADGALNNSGGSVTLGQATAMNVVFNGGSVINSGDLMASNDMVLTSTTSGLTNTGDLVAGRDVSLTGQTDLNTQGELASASDVDLTAVTGDLTSFGGIQAQGAATLTSGRDLRAQGAIIAIGAITVTAARDLVNESNLQSATSLSLQAGRDLTNSGHLLTNGGVALTAIGSVTNSGEGLATGGASGTSLTITGASINQSGNFVAQNDIRLNAQSGGLSIVGDLTAGGLMDLDAQGKLSTTSTLQSGGAFTADANRIEFDGTIVGNTTIDFTAGAGGLAQTGLLLANGAIYLTTTGDVTLTGTAQSATGGIDITGIDVMTTGTIIAATDLDIVASSDLTLGGTAFANNSLTASGATASLTGTATGLDALNLTSTGGNLSVIGTAQSNGALTVASADDLILGTNSIVKSTGDSMTLTAVDIATLVGDIRAFNNIDVTAVTLTQGADLQAGLLATLIADTIQQTGDILAAGLVANATASFNTSGTINASSSITTGAFTNSGAINGNSLTIAAISINNTDSGAVATHGAQVVMTTGALSNAGSWTGNITGTLTVGTALTNSGRLDTGGLLHVTARDVSNTSTGTIEAGAMLFDISNQITNAGLINSEGTAILNADTRLQNTGTIQAAVQLQVKTTDLANTGNVDAFGGSLLIDGLQSFNNAGGTLSSDTGVLVQLDGALNPNGNLGTIQSDGWVTLQGLNGGYLDALTVTESDQIVAHGSLSIKAESITNSGQIASALGNLNLQTQTKLTNTGVIYAGGDWLTLRAGGDVLNDDGTILSANNLVVCGVGSVDCLTDLSADRAETLTNRGGSVIETIGGNIYLAANDILNERDGTLSVTISDPFNRTSKTIGRDTCTTRYCLGNDSHYYHKNINYDVETTIALSGSEASILSADSIVLNSDAITNSYSLISAISSISVQGGSLTNQGAESGIESFTQRENWYYKDKSGRGGSDSIVNTQPAVSVGFAPTVREFGTVEAGGAITGTLTEELNITTITPNAGSLTVSSVVVPTLVSTSQSATQTSVQSFVGATGATKETLTSLADTTLNVQSVGGGTAGAGLGLPADVNDLIIAPRSFDGVGALNPSGGSVQVPDGIVGTLDLSPLSNGQLFGVNPDPMSGYLIETRPDFINQESFVSSDHFLESLNLDHDMTQTRFGDALAETYLIRNQIFELTGRRILTAGLDEREQIRLMYYNAVDAASSLSLRPGVSLTPEQVAALTTDIIWLEERVVSGQTVLVPQVYLAASGGANNFVAATIAAQNIDLDVVALDNNGGALIARNDLIITAANDITNNFGDITSENRLILNSLDGDIRNTSGMVSGGDVTLLANNIFNEVQLTRFGDGENFTDVAGATASIQATGQLMLQAVDNITVTGADLLAGTGMGVFAGGDIDFAALQIENSVNVSGSDYSFESYSLINQTSSIGVANGDLMIISAARDDEGNLIGGGDIFFEGTDINARGAVNVAALDGNVVLAAARDVSYSDSFSENKDLVNSSVEREESLMAAHNVTGISGESISVYGRGTVVNQATGFTTTDGTWQLEAGGGNVVLGSVSDVEANNSYSETAYLGGLLKFSKEGQSLKTTALEVMTDIRGDIDLIAGNNLVVEGGTYNATGQLSTDVGGETFILATVDTEFSDIERHSNNGFIIKDSQETTVKQTASFAEFNAGGGTNFDNPENINIALVGLQAAIGPSGIHLAGVKDGADPTQDMAIAEYFLPDATGPPENRIEELIHDPLATALSAGQASTDSAESEEKTLVAIEGTTVANVASGEPDHNTIDPRYDFEGSRVDITLPTGAEGGGYTYLDNLVEGGANVQDMSLTNHQFYDEQVQLGALGHLALTYLSGQILNAGVLANLSGVNAAMANAAISGTMEGAITGNLDFESLLTDVVFAGVSSYATDAVNIDGLSTDSLLGIGEGQFSISGIANGVVDSTISARLSKVVYGGDFEDNFKSSFVSSVGGMLVADTHTMVGDQFTDTAGNPINGGEGSFGHVATHAIFGCTAGVLLGGDCGTSSAAAATSALMAGAVARADLELENKQALQNEAELFAGLAGALVSGGDRQATQVASTVGGSAFQNNFLYH